MNVVLSKPTGHSVASDNISDDFADIRLMALSEGTFTDMNGTKVCITQSTLQIMSEKYNKKAKLAWESERGFNKDIGPLEEFDNRNAPNCLSHNDKDVREIVGHVIGLMEVRRANDKSYLFMTVRVKGKENVCMVSGRTARWRNVSVQFSLKTLEFSEVSWVVHGADLSARSLMSQMEKPQFYELNTMIALAKSTIVKYNSILESERLLLSACIKGVITKAQSNEITSKLCKFDNPLDVVMLVLSTQSTLRFNPMFVNKDHIPTNLRR